MELGDTPCAHCGAPLRFGSRAAAPIERHGWLVCAACDAAARADAAALSAAAARGLAAFHRAYAPTQNGAVL